MGDVYEQEYLIVILIKSLVNDALYTEVSDSRKLRMTVFVRNFYNIFFNVKYGTLWQPPFSLSACSLSLKFENLRR